MLNYFRDIFPFIKAEFIKRTKEIAEHENIFYKELKKKQNEKTKIEEKELLLNWIKKQIEKDEEFIFYNRLRIINERKQNIQQDPNPDKRNS